MTRIGLPAMGIVLVLAMAMGCTAPAKHGGAEGAIEWTYSGDRGPAKWGGLREDWAACAEGAAQSPIDIRQGVNESELPALEVSYHEVDAVLVNNGHTLEVEYHEGGTLNLDGTAYELLQFHFHAPSEHTVNGEALDMEAHLVHRDAAGNFAVIGVFLVGGEENAFMAKFWDRFPTTGSAVETSIRINAGDLLPADRNYTAYTGSLTTPPCTEGVRWFVMKRPVEVSQAQIDRFVSIIGENARPVQPLKERPLKESALRGR